LALPCPTSPGRTDPPGCSDVVWRYSRNPIITRDAVPGANSIFNSAVVPFNGAFAGVFRCDNTARDMQIHAGFSDDGMATEVVFAYPGIGYIILNAVQNQDYFLLQGCFLFIIIGVLLANFMIDLVYVVVDPRTRLGMTGE
jgi:hypothetical protein